MRHILIACFLLLSACGIAPAPTATPQPSPTTAPTATPIPPTAIPPTVTPIPPTATPLPTATPRPTATPVPTATPIPEKPSIILSGKGNDVVDVKKWPGFATMRITATGNSNFAVWNYDSDGKKEQLLVNTIGAYRGVVLLDLGDDDRTTRLEVLSEGTWQFEIRPVKNSTYLYDTYTYEGRGDDVIMLLMKNLDLLKIQAPGSTSNFAVMAYSLDNNNRWDRSLLVNKIGAYSGTSVLPKGDPALLVIKAVGPWQFTITTK